MKQLTDYLPQLHIRRDGERLGLTLPEHVRCRTCKGPLRAVRSMDPGELLAGESHLIICDSCEYFTYPDVPTRQLIDDLIEISHAWN